MYRPLLCGYDAYGLSAAKSILDMNPNQHLMGVHHCMHAQVDFNGSEWSSGGYISLGWTFYDSNCKEFLYNVIYDK